MNNDFFSGPFHPQPVQQTMQVQTPVKGPGFLSKVISGVVSPFKQLGKAATSAPAAISREIQDKPITDIQKNVFGTNDQGQIAKKIIGSTAGVGATVAPGLEELGLGGKIAQGAVRGGILGGGAAAQNNEDIAKGAGVGALTGGAFEGGLGILGKVLGKGTGAITERAGTIAAGKEALSKAEQAAADATEVAPFSGIHPRVLSQNDLQGTMNLFKNKFGMSIDPETLRNAASTVTGDNGAISGTFRQILAGSKPVNVEGIIDTAKDAINQNAGVLGEAEAKGSAGNALLRSLTASKEQGLFGGLGSLSGEADANKVFDAIQNTDKQIARYSGAEPGTTGEALKNVYQSVKSNLEDRLYKNSGLNEAVSKFKLQPEDETAIREMVTGKGGSQELGDHIVNGINEAKTGQDMRSLQAPFVKANRLADAADQYAQGKGVVADANQTARETAQEAAQANPKSKFNYTPVMTARAANMASYNPAIGGPLLAYLGAKGLASNEGLVNAASSAIEKGGQVAGSALGQAVKNLEVPAAVAATAPQTPQTTTETVNVPSEDSFSGLGDNSQSSTPANSFGVPSSEIAQGMMKALAAGDTKSFSTLSSLYSMAKSEEKASQPSASDTNKTTAATQALNGLQSLGQAFNSTNLSGKGILSKVIGDSPIAGNSIKQINDMSPQIAAAVAKATGAGSASDILKLMPNASDTPTSAQVKIANLTSQIQQYLQNSQVDNNSTSDLSQLAGAFQ